jgi:hypothetical protein
MSHPTALKDLVKAIRSAFNSHEISTTDLEPVVASYLSSNPSPSTELSDDLLDVFLRPAPASPSDSSPGSSASEIGAFVKLLHRLALGDALPRQHTRIWVWDSLLAPLLATSPPSSLVLKWEGINLPRESWTSLREVWNWCWDGDDAQETSPSTASAEPAVLDAAAKKEPADEWGALERRIVSVVLESAGKPREGLLMTVARSKAKVSSFFHSSPS